MINSGTNVNARFSGDGSTALMEAVTYNNTEIVKMLIQAGADVNAKTDDIGVPFDPDDEYGAPPGRITVLMNAVHSSEKNALEVVQLLLQAGADVNAKDEQGGTALMLAVGNLDVVRALLQAGADVNAKRLDGITTLMSAGRYSQGFKINPKVFEVLLNAGADAKVKDYHGNRAIDYAIHSSYLKGTQGLKMLEAASQ